MTTGQQRAFRDLAKKRVQLDKVYQDTPRFFEPTRQVRRADARVAKKELTGIEKRRGRTLFRGRRIAEKEINK